MIALGSNDRHRQARELQEIWRRVSSQHLSGGQGCGCSFGGLMLMASDFELDIVEFVINEAHKAGAPGVEAYIDAVARRGPDRYSLPALLTSIEMGEFQSASEHDIDVVLHRLNRTLSAMESAHSRGRFTCD